MSRPELTPGNGGGKPAKPKPAPLPPSYMDAVEDYEIQQEQRLGISDPPQDPPQLPSAKPPGSNPILLKEKAKEQVERARQEREAARNKQQAPDQNIEKPATSVLQDIEWQDDTKYYDLTGFLQLASNSALAAPTSYESTPLTQGQAQQVDHRLAVEKDPLAREVLITLKRDGMPPSSHWRDFLEQYALSGWDALRTRTGMNWSRIEIRRSRFFCRRRSQRHQIRSPLGLFVFRDP